MLSFSLDNHHCNKNGGGGRGVCGLSQGSVCVCVVWVWLLTSVPSQRHRWLLRGEEISIYFCPCLCHYLSTPSSLFSCDLVNNLHTPLARLICFACWEGEQMCIMWTSQGSTGRVNRAIQARSLAKFNRFRNSISETNTHISTHKHSSIVLTLRLLLREHTLNTHRCDKTASYCVLQV